MKTAAPERGPLLGWAQSRAAVARLKAARLAAGRQSVEVAAAAGLRRGRVSEIETTGVRLRAWEAGRIAAVLGISVADLLPPGAGR